MEIQRQSDYYSLGNPEVRQAHLTADQISKLISGPSITPGLLNTRTASHHVAVDHDRPPYDRSPIEREQIQAIMDDYDMTPEEAIQEYERRTARRTAWHEGQEWNYDPAMHTPEDEGHDYTQQEIDEEDYLNDLENLIPEEDVEGGEFGFENGGWGRQPNLREDGYEIDPGESGWGPEPGFGKEASDEVKSDLLQAVGDEVSTIGEYQGFLDEAQEAGDDQAADALSESINDEQDHAKNFGEALAREAYYRYRS